MTKKLLLVILACSCLAGCRRQPEPKEEPKPDAADLMEKLWQKAGQLHSEHQTNAVLRLFDDAVWEEDLAPFRSQLLSEALRLRLEYEDLEGAQAKYLEILEKDSELAGQVTGQIASHLLRQGEHEMVIEWCVSLLDTDFEPGVKGQLLNSILNAQAALEDMDGVTATYAQCVKIVPAQAESIIGRSLNGLLGNGRHDDLDLALLFVEENFSERPGFPQLVVRTRFDSLLARDRLEEAGRLLVSSFGLLSDRNAARRLASIVKAATEAVNAALAEELCVKAMDAAANDSNLMYTAAREWTVLAKSAEDEQLIAERFDSVVARELPVNRTLSIASKVVYFAMDKGTQEIRASLLNNFQTILERAAEDNDKSWASMLMLDGCFMSGDFDRALKLLETPIPGKEPDWQQMLVHKVRAHKALAANDHETAVGEFRAFMKTVATSEEELMDPSTNREVPKEAVLGLNAARIGDIWTKAGETGKAEAAYDEAREYYAEALNKTLPNSPQRKQLAAELAKVPGVEK